MKKVFCILTALLLLLALCACSAEDTDCFYFKNETGAKIHGFYVSAMDSDEWGDKLNYAIVSQNGQITIDISKLPNGAGSYDIGAIDENEINYDFYEIPIAVGDILALSRSGDTAILNITHADGTANEYFGYAY